MKRIRWASLALAAATAFGASAALAAAPEAAKPGLLEEIVVTATKRETSLQNVPFSVAAQTGDQIRANGASNIVELARTVAGLTITDLGPGQSQIAIRGVSAGQVIRDQPGVKPQVGVYLDESPISLALFTPDLDMFDLDRFEILRGPQGTLFGSGSIAGTLRYITAQPKLGATEGSYALDASSVAHGGLGGDVKAAINLPMGDRAAARLVGYYDALPGWINAFGPNGSVERSANSGTKSGGRVSLLFKQSDSLTITPRFVYQKLSTDGFPRVDAYNILGNRYTTTEPPVTVGKYGQYRQFREGIDDDFRLGDLKIEADLGAVALTSITSDTARTVLVTRDATQLTGSVTYQFGGTSADIRDNSPLYDHHALHSFSQELRLASLGKGTFQWVVGAFYEHMKRDYGQDLPTPGYDAIVQRLIGPSPGLTSAANGAPADTPFYSDLHYNFKQSALFGEATVQFSDQWALTGGLRWFKFDEDRTLYFAGLFANYTPTPVPGSTSSNGAAPRLILTFKASDDINLNLQASRGFRLGGINDPLNASICTPADLLAYGGHDTWGPEWAWNYEFGAKMRFMERRVTFNIAAFYTDLKDLQAPVDAGSCSSRVVYNVPKARSTGFEAELFARPNANWDFGVSATYADAKLQATVTNASSPVPIGGLQDGARMPTAPKLQAIASIGYTRANALWGQWDFFGNVIGQYVGSSYALIGDEVAGFGTVPAGSFFRFGNPTITSFTFDPQLPAYHIANLRAGIRHSGLEFAAFINNLTDEQAYLSLDRERGRRARVGYLTNPPRTFGLSMLKKF